jgi:hypothetical protein
LRLSAFAGNNSSAINFSQDNIQRSDYRNHVRDEMPDTHLPERL